MTKTDNKNKLSIKVGDIDYGVSFVWTPDTIKSAAGHDLTTDGKTRFSVEGNPYELAGYGEVNGARVGIAKALDGNYEAIYQPLEEVTVTASPGKSLKTANGDYANTSDDYYKWRVGTQFANNVNKASLGMMASGVAPIAISAAPLSYTFNSFKPFIPDILSGFQIGTGADLAMKLGSGRTYGEWGQYYLSPYLKKYMSPETANTVSDLAGESLNPGGWFGSYKNLANAANTIYRPLINYKDNVERRAIETAMRTTSSYDPSPMIVSGLYNSIKSDKKRLFDISKYILFNKKTGPKGYYNSLAPYKGNSLKQGIAYYDGYGITGSIDADDMIDAFLYQKKIDPKYQLQQIFPDDYGIHTDYVKKYYPNKKIQQYQTIPEKWDSDIVVNDSEVTPLGEEPHTNGFLYNTAAGSPNVAGNRLRVGVTKDGKLAVSGQDIWKFNKEQYRKKWIEKQGGAISNYENVPKVIRRILPTKLFYKTYNKILDFGLGEVDRLGTPIIIKTPWFSSDSKVRSAFSTAERRDGLSWWDDNNRFMADYADVLHNYYQKLAQQKSINK